MINYVGKGSGTYTTIPNNLIKALAENYQLTGHDIIILFQIMFGFHKGNLSKDSSQNPYTVSYRELAKFLCIDKNTVNNSIRSLIKSGLLFKKGRSGYIVNVDQILKMTERYSVKEKEEKAKKQQKTQSLSAKFRQKHEDCLKLSDKNTTDCLDFSDNQPIGNSA
jgi:DNA-binding transcriptional regulator YhcF (GntR family)